MRRKVYLQADSFNGTLHHAEVLAAGGDPAWAFALQEVKSEAGQDGSDDLIQAGVFAAKSQDRCLVIDLQASRQRGRLPILSILKGDFTFNGKPAHQPMKFLVGFTNPLPTDVWDAEFAKLYGDHVGDGLQYVRQSNGVAARPIPAATIDAWVKRHLAGDWGTLRDDYPDDAALMDEVFANRCGRIHSTFEWLGKPIWVMSYIGDGFSNKEITVFLPEEY